MEGLRTSSALRLSNFLLMSLIIHLFLTNLAVFVLKTGSLQQSKDTVEVIKTSEQIATELFRQKKQLDDETFKKLYEVKQDDGNRLTRL